MSDVLDRFFEHYYKRRPVNATFTGIREYDWALPDWSDVGLWSLDAEMHALRAELLAAHPAAATDDARVLRDDVDALDAKLAVAFLDIQIAENASGHGVRGNPALWSGEAVFSIASLMMRDLESSADIEGAVTARCGGLIPLLAEARDVMRDAPIPAEWVAKALRDCEGAEQLLTKGIDAWLIGRGPDPETANGVRLMAGAAREAFRAYAAWLHTRKPTRASTMSCGAAMYDLLLSQGHQCTQSRTELLAEARAAFAVEKVKLAELAASVAGSWENAQAQMADDHPSAENYFKAFEETWARCHARALEADVVTWADWPIRYVPFPAATRDAAPYLYYLFYRSPAPFSRYTVYDYVVPPLPDDAAAREKHLRAWNQSVITLNHVVHHGAIGHHVQNWHAYHRATSRIGKIAAVDCANRVGMFCAGTMAEGWACYATELMEELDFLTPLERVSEQHSRIRFLARAIVDIELHQGTMTVDECVAFYRDEVGMSADVARAETTKNGMFPCTAIMYWLGTQGILDLRRDLQARHGAAFSLKTFHDTLLGYGSIPVPLVSRLMLAEAV